MHRKGYDNRVGERRRRSDLARQHSQAIESIAPFDGCVTRFMGEADRDSALTSLIECEVYLLSRA
jgi:hypothetical protein